MTALLPLVIFVLTVGCSAFLAYLVTDAKLTEPLRDRLIHTLTAPQREQHKAAMTAYQQRVQTALVNHQNIPADAPEPPPEPVLATLIQCRWCTGLWISLLVTLTARLCLTAPYLPLWHSIPLRPLDWLIVPAWALATAYAVGFLASREGT